MPHGVDFLKYDWCNHGTANAEETYKTMRDGLYAAGRPVVFSLCEWGNNKPWLWRRMSGISGERPATSPTATSARCLCDGLEVYPERPGGPGKIRRPGPLERPGHAGSGNPGLSLNESRAHFSLWCMLAAPLMAGNDVRKMSPEIRAILTDKEVIAIDQDPLASRATSSWSSRERKSG